MDDIYLIIKHEKKCGSIMAIKISDLKKCAAKFQTLNKQIVCPLCKDVILSNDDISDFSKAIINLENKGCALRVGKSENIKF